MLKTQDYPKLWKSYDMRPLPKTKSPQAYNEYRPIALSFHLAKAAESCIIKSIRDATTSKTQFAYTKGTNTTHALIKMLHDWTSALDQPGYRYIQCLCADMSKAFDRMEPKKLLDKLYDKGVNDNTIHLIHDYLIDRRYQTTVNSYTSSDLSVSMGVPQGSRLGPLLWLIYISDLEPSCDITKYADDCTLYIPMSNTADSKLQKDVDYLAGWCNKNNMQLNERKSFVMNISSKPLTTSSPVLMLDDNPLSLVTETKILGVTIDCSLSFKSHVDKICAKANTRIFLLKSLHFYGANEQCKLQFYTACVLPILVYAFEAWYGFLSECSRNKLERTQNHALKIIYCDSILDSYKQRLQHSGLLSITDLYKEQSKKCFNNLPACLNVFIVYNTERKSSRCHAQSLYRFSFNTSLFKKSFFISNFLNS